MNASSITLEICVIALGVVLMLADFWMPADRKKFAAYAAIAALGGLLLISLSGDGVCTVFGTAFNGEFVEDGLALFFKRFFIVAAILVLFMSAEFSDRIAAGISEYYSLIVFALAGMLFAASANDFAMLFVSIELITITFYVLVSFQRSKIASLEAGVKYLILGALSSSFLVFGIALIWGTTGKLNFTDLAAVAAQFEANKLFLLGVLFVMVGLGFKIAAFPFQIWAPDVYQGAPTPTTGVSGHRFKSRRICFVAARFIYRRSGSHGALGGFAHRHFRRHDSLRKSLRDSAAQSETAARLFQHRARGLSAAGRGGIERERPGGGDVLSGRLFVHRAGGVHGDLPSDAADGRGRHLRAGGLEPAFAAAGRDDDAGDGIAGGHSAAGGLLWEIPAAEIRDCGRRKPRGITVITA